MYIRKTVNKYKGKPYTNYLLVESVATPKGPRQRTICSLGNLKPRPREEWLLLARKVERALSGGQQPLPLEEPDPLVEEIAAKARAAKEKAAAYAGEAVAVLTDEVAVECAREAGTVHVANQMWRRLGMDEVLGSVGFSEKERLLTQIMVANRLVSPSSEHAMPDWAERTALGDILGADLSGLNSDALYRQMDHLYPMREGIERELAAREKNLFNLDGTVFLYDLTSTYFEGQCLKNPQAQRGYSRDGRGDCKQVVVGLVVDRDGFPKAHEVFDGNRSDSTTVEEMLGALLYRTGKVKGATVVLDRGMSSGENLIAVKALGWHYVVAARHEERYQWLDEFETADDWTEVVREPSPTNPGQKKTSIRVLKRVRDDETYVLCLSEERKPKDRAIRENQEKDLRKDLARLEKRVSEGRLKDYGKIHEAIGRLKERYPRVARYYDISYSEASGLIWREEKARKEIAEKLDGSYALKTDRSDLSADEAWRIYSLLTRAEAAFEAMKSPLAERPIFHQLQERVQTHIFLCILAYHLLVSIEKTLRDKGCHLSWQTVRETLRTHQVVTVVLPTVDGDVLRIRRSTTPEPQHLELYKLLDIDPEIMKPIKTWSVPDS